MSLCRAAHTIAAWALTGSSAAKIRSTWETSFVVVIPRRAFVDRVQYASAMSWEEKKRGALTDSQRISIGVAKYRGSSRGSTAFLTGLSNDVTGIRTEEGRRGFVFTSSLGMGKGGNGWR